MLITIVREVNGRIYLDNGVFVDLITQNYCPICKQVSEEGKLCYDCNYKFYSFNSVLTLGYYIRRWYRRHDAFIVSEIKHWTQYQLHETNQIYRFCKLINDVKKRNTVQTINEKKNIIKTLCKGFAWKLKRYDISIINIIDYIVHVPKYDENIRVREPTNFNHGFYYSYFLSEELNIPFLADLIIENDSYRERNLNRFAISRDPQRIKYKNVMIVDDVYTNAKTKQPIAQLLRINGAKEVTIGVLGRTKR